MWRCVGALGRTRTCNPRSRKPARYPLCYKGFRAIGRELNPPIAESQSTVLPLHHDRHGTGSYPLRRRRDSNPQPRMKRRLVSTELHYRSATPPEMLCEWRIGESNPCPARQVGALTTELHGQ